MNDNSYVVAFWVMELPSGLFNAILWQNPEDVDFRFDYRFVDENNTTRSWDLVGKTEQEAEVAVDGLITLISKRAGRVCTKIPVRGSLATLKVASGNVSVAQA